MELSTLNWLTSILYRTLFNIYAEYVVDEEDSVVPEGGIFLTCGMLMIERFWQVHGFYSNEEKMMIVDWAVRKPCVIEYFIKN